MKLSIIIVNWNTRELLQECLASTRAEIERLPTEQIETFVVDNVSTDGSVAMVQQKFPWVKLIVNGENEGFAKANNMALRKSAGIYTLLLNPDTIVKPGAFAHLLAYMNTHPQAGAAGSRLLNPDGTLQPSCFPTPTLSRELWRLFHLDKLRHYALYEMGKWDTNTPRLVDVVQGTSLILRQSALDEVGLLDENYFMYSEEVDICYRLKKAGWQLAWVPKSKIVHYGGQSTKQAAAAMFLQLYKNKLTYFRKHHGRFAAFGYKLILLASAITRLLLSPLAWLQKSPQRQLHLSLAKNYGRLAMALPKM